MLPSGCGLAVETDGKTKQYDRVITVFSILPNIFPPSQRKMNKSIWSLSNGSATAIADASAAPARLDGRDPAR